MATVYIGHASISELGTVNGTKGDSTGKEVCTRTWYSKPWDFMAIYPDEDVREAIATACEAGCANDKIGYGQSDRNTLYTQAKAVNFDLAKITTACNCDCSSFMNVCCVCAGVGSYGSNGWTTSTMKSALKSAGFTIVTSSSYLNSSSYCVRGAIYVATSTHTVCGLTNGSLYEKTLSAAGCSTSSSSTTTTSTTTTSSSSSSIYTVTTGVTGTVYTLSNIQKGSSGETVKFAQQLLNAYGSYGLDEDGEFGTKTYNATIKYQKAKSLTQDGIIGPKTWAALLATY